MTDTPQIVHHYDAATAPRGFLRHALPMFGYPWRAWEARGLVWNFFRRELLGRFRGSLGGVFWVMVQPLFQFAVFFFVFGILFAPKDEIRGGPDPYFAVYLFAGIALFGSIQEGTGRALTSIVQNGNLVRKVVFPCELLPLTPVMVALVVYAVSCLVLLAFGLLVGEVHIGPAILAWPVLLLCLAVFAVGLGLFLATSFVFARDVHHLWSVLSLAWFFLSPIFWRLPIVREKVDHFGVPWAIDLLVLNPAYCMLMAQRQVFGIGDRLPPEEYVQHFPLGLGENLLWAGAWALFSFFFGFGFFMSRKHKFADIV